MLTINYVDALAISLYALTLFWGVVGVTIVLERKRQHKLPHYFIPIGNTPIQPSTRLPQTKFVTQEVHRVRLNSASQYVKEYDSNREYFRHIGYTERIPIRPGTSDQIIIHIEPDGTPSEDKRNIQRLITHLQSMTDKVAS